MKYIRFIILSLAGINVIRELALCVIDKILHTTFVITGLFFICLLFSLIYIHKEEYKYRVISIIAGAAIVVTSFLAVLWSPKYFECEEMFNGSIGFVSVVFLKKDIYCVSNGRVKTGGLYYTREYYIVRRNRGEFALLDYYKKTASEDTTCKVNQDGSLFFYKGDGDDVLAAASVLKKTGYDILRVNAIDEYKYKNIFGGTFYG